MQKKSSLESKQKLFEYARYREGLFTTKLAEKAGFHRSHHSYHVRAGNWIREMRGIYSLARFPQDDSVAQLVLWHLWSRNRNDEPQGVYSHDTALRIYDLGDLMPAKLHMTVPTKFRRFKDIPDILVLYKANISQSDIRRKDGYAVTTPARTILDMVNSGFYENYVIEQVCREAFDEGMLSSEDELRISKVFDGIQKI